MRWTAFNTALLLLLATSYDVAPRTDRRSAGADCPCEYCGNTTYCNRKQHASVPLGLPTAGVTRLLLDHNNITTIHEHEFEGMSGLVELDLNHNRIHSIERGAFAGLVNLKHLYLDHNLLTTVRTGALLDHLPNLRRLFLDNNRLSTLPDDVPYMVELERLTLTHNRVTRVDWAAFTALHRLRLVRLWKGNPLTCDCNALELARWFRDRKPALASGNAPADCQRAPGCRPPHVLSLRANNNGSQHVAVYDAGSRGVLQCSASGRPPPLLVWLHPLVGAIYPFRPRGMRVQAFRNGTLTVESLQRNDSGQYACYASLSSLRPRDSREMDVLVAANSAEIRAVNTSLQVQEGASVRLSCAVSEQHAVRWRAPGSSEFLPPADVAGEVARGRFATEEDGRVLTIASATADDGGSWECAIQLPGSGWRDASIELQVTSSGLAEKWIVIVSVCAGVVVVAIAVIACACHLRRNATPPPRNINNNATADATQVDGGELRQPYEHAPEVRGFRL